MNCSNAFSCNGQWIPNGGGCGAGAIWTLISPEISHPGRGLTQTSQTWDSFAISSYTVRKEGLYSITNGSISSPPSRLVNLSLSLERATESITMLVWRAV